MKTINTAQVRSMNHHSVRRQLLLLHSATKAQLAAATGLSSMTVGTIITQMQRDGEVFELDAVPSSGGRPSVRYAYEKDFALMMIVYGYQKADRNLVCVRIRNLFGEIVAACEQFMENVTLERLECLMDQTLEKGTVPAGTEVLAGLKVPEGTEVPMGSEVPAGPVTAAGRPMDRDESIRIRLREKVRVIGFGLPGVERDGRIVSNDYSELVGTDFIAHFRQRYGAEIRFINDINAAAYGYYDRMKPFSACEDMELSPAVVGIYYPRLYYPGVGIIIDGKIYLGSQNFAGEVCRLPYGGPGTLYPADWLAINYGNREQVCACIAGHLSQICSVLAPERIVLYGDFFSPEDIGRISELTEQLLEGRFHVQLDIVADLSGDFERGLSVLMEDLLYRTVFDGEGL